MTSPNTDRSPRPWPSSTLFRTTPSAPTTLSRRLSRWARMSKWSWNSVRNTSRPFTSKRASNSPWVRLAASLASRPTHHLLEAGARPDEQRQVALGRGQGGRRRQYREHRARLRLVVSTPFPTGALPFLLPAATPTRLPRQHLVAPLPAHPNIRPSGTPTLPSGRAAPIFISHSAVDKVVAQRLAGDLKFK